MFNLLKTRNPKTGTLADSVDPDEMPHNAAFHQYLHCLVRQNQTSEKEIHYLLEIITCDPSIYTMDHPCLTVSNFIGNSNGPKRVKIVMVLSFQTVGCVPVS